MAKPTDEQKPKGTLKFRANWKLDGLPSGDLLPGDIVKLTEEQAAPFVESGVISPVEDKGE